MDPGKSLVASAIKTWLIRGLVAALVGVGGFAAYQSIKTSQPKTASNGSQSTKSAKKLSPFQEILLKNQGKSLLTSQSTKTQATQSRLTQAQIESEGKKAKGPGYCPDVDQDIAYRPYNNNISVTIPAHWCIGFGYGNGWDNINDNRDWYFFSPLKIGAEKPEDVGSMPPVIWPLNDNYFCGPIGEGGCGTFYDYINGIDNNNSYTPLPTLENILNYDNALIPRMMYNMRLFARDYNGLKEQDIKDFIRQGTPGKYTYQSQGAGYFYNNRLTDQVRNRLSGKDKVNTAKDKDFYPQKDEEPAYNSDPLDLKIEQRFPWSNSVKEEFQAGRLNVYVFDLYVRCTPPDIGDWPTTDEKGKPLLSGDRTPDNPNPSVAEITFRQAHEIEQEFTSYQELSDEFGEVSDDSHLNLRDFVDLYYGGCLNVFGRRWMSYSPEPDNRIYWENTGAKAYIFYRPAGNGVNRNRFYEFRTESPKLVRYECVDAVGNFNQCQESPVGKLGQYGANFLRYYLGQNLGDFKNIDEAQRFVDACSGETNPDAAIPKEFQDVSKARLKELLIGCRFTNWWVLQLRNDQKMLHSLQFCTSLTTQASANQECIPERK